AHRAWSSWPCTSAARNWPRRSPVMALPGETCRIVATRLAVHGLERLPVVADAQSRRLVGIVSRSDLVKPSVAFFDEEQRRERFRRAPLAGARVQLELRRRRARRTPN
ncbi:CBS domain-containing protein, partial [Ralstonia pseudosolanacearum]|uniref:CBS domain-containing protein n=1 Tax=Ralstonia pseudosolanacearum TaxID=1310165 RepID=UPI003221BB25